MSLHLNLDYKATLRAVRQFKARINGGDEAVFYFASHGVQFDAANYLLPLDIAAENLDQVKDDALPLQRVLDDRREQKARFSLAIIDACRDGFANTAPGASFKPNAFGLYDMLGNVEEWVADCFRDNYLNALEDGRAQTTSAKSFGCSFVARGGSWLDGPADVRSTRRRHAFANSANNAFSDFGFRAARNLP